ncbi:MAG: hypothetical protein M0D55_12745 [Elusimicrobiota bacterium]|nr:MAG: hypothetical protein M0D55_12745 [Elusimicrobiota bacterium]
MTANVSFLVRRKEDAILVPAAAVKDGPGGKRVVTIPSEDRKSVETRAVKTGIESDDQIEIVEGLAEGEKVLLSQGGYVAQKAPETSPLSSMPGRGRGMGQTQGAAPRPRQRSGSASSGSAPAH